MPIHLMRLGGKSGFPHFPNLLANGSWDRIHVCDLPEKYGALQRLYSGPLPPSFLSIEQVC
jgi:hypothetical protein